MCEPSICSFDCELHKAIEGALGEVCHTYGPGYEGASDVVRQSISYVLGRPNAVHALDFTKEQVRNVTNVVVLYLAFTYRGGVTALDQVYRVFDLIALTGSRRAA